MAPVAMFFSRMFYTEWPVWFNKADPMRTTILEVSPKLTCSIGDYIYHALEHDAQDEVRVAYFQDDSVNFAFFQGTGFIPGPIHHILVPTHVHMCL